MKTFTKNSKKIQALGWLVLASQVGFASLALSQENTSATSTQSQSTWDKTKEKLKLQYVGEFSGPSMNKLSVPDANGNPSDAISLVNKLSAGYRFNKRFNLDGTFVMTYNPLGSDAEKIDPSVGAFVINDPFLRFSDGELVKIGNFKMVGDLRAYIPVSTSSQGKSQIGGFRNSLFSGFDIPNSKWNFGHYSIIRANVFGGAGNGKGDYLNALFSLHGDYAFTPKLGLYLWTDLVEAGFSRKTSAWSSEYVNAQVGVSWDATSFLNFNPYIKVLPGVMSLSTTTINMNVTAAIF